MPIRTPGIGLVLLVLASFAYAGELEVEWDPSADAAGYTVYWGPNPGQYTNWQDVGDVTVATVRNLPDCIPMYIAVTAYNSAGESGYSNEIVDFEDTDGDGVLGLCDHFPDDGQRSGPLHVGTVTAINHLWQTVALPEVYQDPIIIVGPPSLNGGDPGVIRIDNVTSNSFDIRYQEWLYLDSIHSRPETVSYLVMERGRYVMDDGSIWEIGTFPLGGTDVFQAQTFSAAFPSKPTLLLAAQTLVDSQPVTVRARDVSVSGFTAGFFTEEASTDTEHDPEVVGYLAIHSSVDSGTVTVDGLSARPYALLSSNINSQLSLVLAWNLIAQEERSADAETRHGDESVAVLALGSHLFAQDINFGGLNTITLRRIDPDPTAGMEWGMIDGLNSNQWLTIPLAKSYVDPVVIAKPLAGDSEIPGVIRLRNIDTDSFEIRLMLWDYLNGTQAVDRVFYVVSESGHHELAGLQVEAGALDTDATVVAGTWAPVSFGSPFGETPAIFSAVQTHSGHQPVVTRNTGSNPAGFSVAMEEEEGLDGLHKVETVGWIAIEPGTGYTEDGRAVEIFTQLVDSNLTPVTFLLSYARRHPAIIADVASNYDSDPCGTRLASFDANGAELFLEEEQSGDAEMDHPAEDVSILVAE